jgi:hypothetical protein
VEIGEECDLSPVGPFFSKRGFRDTLIAGLAAAWFNSIVKPLLGGTQYLDLFLRRRNIACERGVGISRWCFTFGKAIENPFS